MQKCKYRSSHIIKQERDVGRIEEPILFKEKLQAALYSLQLYQKGTFPTYFFQWIFRVPVLFNKCFEKVLKNYTVNFLSLRLEKHQNAISMCSAKGKKRALQRECFEKGSRKTVMSDPDSVTLPYDFIKTRLHRERFPKYMPIFFSGKLFHKTALSNWI